MHYSKSLEVIWAWKLSIKTEEAFSMIVWLHLFGRYEDSFGAKLRGAKFYKS